MFQISCIEGNETETTTVSTLIDESVTTLANSVSPPDNSPDEVIDDDENQDENRGENDNDEDDDQNDQSNLESRGVAGYNFFSVICHSKKNNSITAPRFARRKFSLPRCTCRK